MLFCYNPLKSWFVILCVVQCSGCELEEDLVVPPVIDAAPTAVVDVEAPLYAPSPSPFADSLLDAVEVYIEAAQYDSAIATTIQAGEVYEQIDFKEGIIRSIVLHADALERWGKYDEALGLLNENLDVAYDWLGEDHLLIGDMYNKLGVIAYRRGYYTLAIEHFFESLFIRQERLGSSNFLVGRSKNNIGASYADLGDFDKALEFYKEALSIRLGALGENNGDVAQDYNNIGVALKNKGDFDESLIFHERALSIRIKVFDDAHPAVGASYYNTGITHSSKGQFEKAIENHKKSLEIWEKSFPDGHPLIGYALGALSSDYRGLERYEEALAYEKRSLAEASRTMGVNHFAAGYSFQNIGRILHEKGDFDGAMENYLRMVHIWNNNSVKQHPALSQTYCKIGELFHEQNEFDKALDYVDLCFQANHLEYNLFYPEEELDINDFSSDKELLQSLILRAQIYRSQAEYENNTQSLETALRTYQKVLGVIEAHSLSFKNNGSKLLLAEQATQVYEEGIQVALQLLRITGDESYLNSAFQFAEQGKASVLIDAMNEADALKTAGIPDSLLQQEKELRLLLTHHDKTLKSELIKGERADQKRVSSEKENFFKVKKNYDDLVDTFEKTYPAYYDLKYTSYTASLNDVVDKMLSPEELMIEYVLGRDSLYIFLVADSFRDIEVVPIDSTLDNHVENFRRGLGERNRNLYIPSAYALYSVLVEPVLDIAQKRNTWVIVADDMLNGIPFGAFISEYRPVNSNYFDLPFLIHNHSFRYIYSATLELNQDALKMRKHVGIAGGESEKKDFMAFAPVFEGGITGWERGTEMLEGFKPDSVSFNGWGHLPQSEKEVESIHSMFRKKYPLWKSWFGDQSQIYLHEEASEHTLKTIDLSQYKYVHLATHGVVNKSVPELSGIIMAQDTTGGEDGILHLSEVYNLDLDAELVVLSACQTGVGKVARGEGLMSLTRGFMYAGADALLASYWQVGDGSTNSLMVSFYDYLLNGYSKTESLRLAKMDLMDRYPQLAHPYYWASFALIGK